MPGEHLSTMPPTHVGLQFPNEFQDRLDTRMASEIVLCFQKLMPW